MNPIIGQVAPLYGILIMISAPLFSVLLSTFNLLIRLSHGTVKKAGGDLMFAAASIEMGFFGVDLNQRNVGFLVMDIMMFLIFFCMWAALLWYLKVKEKCQSCSQHLAPSDRRSTL